jgi:excisionase family DNA binding protein
MNDWLSLSEAASLLGVHPSTARNWADTGRLTVHRTKGGHRRFRRSDIELWTQAEQVNSPGEADLVVQSALGRTRFQISEGRLQQESWYAKLDQRAREQYRRSGRSLLKGLTLYLQSNESSGSAEARSLGFEYASIARRCQLKRTEAVQAFLLFRSLLVDSMISVYESAAVRNAVVWGDALRKINAFTDEVLLALLERYREESLHD